MFCGTTAPNRFICLRDVSVCDARGQVNVPKSLRRPDKSLSTSAQDGARPGRVGVDATLLGNKCSVTCFVNSNGTPEEDFGALLGTWVPMRTRTGTVTTLICGRKHIWLNGFSSREVRGKNDRTGNKDAIRLMT
jgi:hypothetical protein